MRADVSRICNECDCAMLKRRRGRREPLHQYIVGVPMERLAMDVAGPYPVTSAGNQYCLMVGCYFSKWLECFPIPDQKATTVARKLVFEIVARYGAFRELHSDQGTNFGSKVVLEVCRLFGIHKTRTTPYHPRSDGFIERSFRTLGRCLKAACRETKQEWDELVPVILMSYWAMPQASTGVTPNMMMLGRQTRLPVQAMYGARPASDLEGDPEAAELDQEEAGGAEPPSAQLELAILNGLDISSLPALRDLSTRASTTVHIPWPPVGMERATPDGRRPRPWRSSWEDAGVSITAAGVARRDNDRSAASMPQISRRTEGCGLPECTIARSAGCWTDWSPRGPRDIESPRA